MSNLLFIQAFPRGMQSKSIQIAQTYLSILREQNPDLNIDVLSLWDVDLPAFDGNRAAAKITVMLGQEPTYILLQKSHRSTGGSVQADCRSHNRRACAPTATFGTRRIPQLESCSTT
jgi:FMN-dependent NADH-azoreductase